LISYSGVSGGNLPPCSGQPTPRTWTNCHGSYHQSDGQKYVGEFRDGLPNGQGTATFSALHKSAGAKYVGEFKDGNLHGQGTLTFASGGKNGNIVYVGAFKDGKRHGQGTATYVSGAKYVGEHRDGKKNGEVVNWVSPKHFNYSLLRFVLTISEKQSLTPYDPVPQT
jgi:hypothetical protein